jgi:hypothetical protein
MEFAKTYTSDKNTILTCASVWKLQRRIIGAIHQAFAAGFQYIPAGFRDQEIL